MGEMDSDATPEIFGNHEVTVGNDLVSINYKMSSGGFSLREIAGQPAYKVLPKVLGDKEYKKMFKEQQVLEESDGKLRDVYDLRPDLFEVSLKGGLEQDVLQKMKKEFPDCFDIDVLDDDKYISEVSTAKYTTELTTGPSFIEKAGKLDDDVKHTLRKLFRKVFTAVAVSAVKCGNKASA